MGMKKISSTIYELRHQAVHQSHEAGAYLKHLFLTALQQNGLNIVCLPSCKQCGENLDIAVVSNDEAQNHIGVMTACTIEEKEIAGKKPCSELKANISITNRQAGLPDDEYEVYIQDDHSGTAYLSLHTVEHYHPGQTELFVGSKL